jgi:hypothetical protein
MLAAGFIRRTCVRLARLKKSKKEFNREKEPYSPIARRHVAGVRIGFQRCPAGRN